MRQKLAAAQLEPWYVLLYPAVRNTHVFVAHLANDASESYGSPPTSAATCAYVVRLTT